MADAVASPKLASPLSLSCNWRNFHKSTRKLLSAFYFPGRTRSYTQDTAQTECGSEKIRSSTVVINRRTWVFFLPDYTRIFRGGIDHAVRVCVCRSSVPFDTSRTKKRVRLSPPPAQRRTFYPPGNNFVGDHHNEGRNEHLTPPQAVAACHTPVSDPRRGSDNNKIQRRTIAPGKRKKYRFDAHIQRARTTCHEQEGGENFKKNEEAVCGRQQEPLDQRHAVNRRR